MLRRLAMVLVYRGLLGTLFAALLFSPPSQAQSKSASAELSPSQPQTDGGTSRAAADLLVLIKQIKPLRVTVPYVDFHDQAIAAQTQYQRMRRGAGLRRLTGSRPSYDASQGSSDKQPANRGGGTTLNPSGVNAHPDGSRDSSQSR